jgi:hypothetical protein
MNWKILNADLDVEVPANSTCVGVKVPWLDQESSGADIHRAGPEGSVLLLQVVESDEEVFRLVGGN